MWTESKKAQESTIKSKFKNANRKSTKMTVHGKAISGKDFNHCSKFDFILHQQSSQLLVALCF